MPQGLLMKILEIPLFTLDKEATRSLLGKTRWQQGHYVLDFDYARLTLGGNYEIIVYLLEPLPDQLTNALYDAIIPPAPLCLFWHIDTDDQMAWLFNNINQLFETLPVAIYHESSTTDDSNGPPDGENYIRVNDETSLEDLVMKALNLFRQRRIDLDKINTNGKA